MYTSSKWLLATYNCNKTFGNVMAATQNLLKSGYGCDFIRSSSGNGFMILMTLFLCSMYAWEGYKLIAIIYIGAL